MAATRVVAMETANNMAGCPSGPRPRPPALAFLLRFLASWSLAAITRYQQGWFPTIATSSFHKVCVPPSHSSEMHCHPLTFNSWAVQLAFSPRSCPGPCSGVRGLWNKAPVPRVRSVPHLGWALWGSPTLVYTQTHLEQLLAEFHSFPTFLHQDFLLPAFCRSSKGPCPCSFFLLLPCGTLSSNRWCIKQQFTDLSWAFPIQGKILSPYF